MIECPSCGAKLKYDINSQMIKCDFCKSTFDPKSVDLKANVAKEITIENLDNLVEAVEQKLREVHEGLYNRALENREKRTYLCKNMDEIIENIEPTAEIILRIKPIYNFKATN